MFNPKAESTPASRVTTGFVGGADAAAGVVTAAAGVTGVVTAAAAGVVTAAAAGVTGVVTAAAAGVPSELTTVEPGLALALLPVDPVAPVELVVVTTAGGTYPRRLASRGGGFMAAGALGAARAEARVAGGPRAGPGVWRW